MIRVIGRSKILRSPALTASLLSLGLMSGTSLDGIHVVVPAVGDITGSGSVNTERVLAFKMRLIVGKTRGLVPTAAALGSIPFTVTGTSDEPVFHPDVKAFASDKTQFVTHGADSAKVRIKALVTPKKK